MRRDEEETEPSCPFGWSGMSADEDLAEAAQGTANE